MLRRFCLLVALVWFAGGAVCARGEVDEGKIEAARKRGLDFLRKANPTMTLGELALAGMVLLKNDEPLDSPIVKAAVERTLAQINTAGYSPSAGKTDREIYESGVSLMLLANADPEQYRSQIQAIANYIIARQLPNGSWDYPHLDGGDTSVTQYAVLGLWEASRAGIRVPPRVWDKVATWHLKTQQQGGGFAYKPATVTTQLHTMTNAGAGSLYVARLHLYPKAGDLAPGPDEKDAALAKAKRLRRKYGFLYPVIPGEEDLPPRNPGGAMTSTVVQPGDNTVTTNLAAIDRALSRATQWIETDWTARPTGTSWSWYYLYCVERFGALSGKTEIGNHDWYDEGAAALLQAQSPSGSWQDNSGIIAGTSFAVLFLGKATAKLLDRPAGRSRKPKLGSGLLAGGRGLPANLNQLQFDNGELSVKKLKGPVADLLAELEKSDSVQVESAQATLVDQVITETPEALVGAKDRLKKLAVDRRPEVRRTAFWALGRTDDQRLAPLLIAGLEDPEHDCVVEAQQALVFLSRKVSEPDLPEELTPDLRRQLVARWKTWYLTVRPYDERDDLTPRP